MERSHRTDDEEFYIPCLPDIKEEAGLLRKATVWLCYCSLLTMIEAQPGFARASQVLLDADELRRRVGLTFATPVPLPGSVFDNVAYGPRVHGTNRPSKLQAIVERCLRQVRMWDEISGRLDESALGLTDEQRQRLCIARMLAVEPEVLLMDEPCSALDPIATLHIEELMRQLREKYTIVIVTHNMQQAARASDYCGFMLLGELKEFGTTGQILKNPQNPDTENYISGRFG